MSVNQANVLKDISMALGLGDLSEEERFNTPERQVENRDALNDILAERFAEKTTEVWVDELEPQGVICGRVNTFEEATQDLQVHANKMVVEMEHPHGGNHRGTSLAG